MHTRDPYRIPPANALIAFESAARHGNFTLAARELHTTQSAVSRQLGNLEEWLSARLFERSRAGATLTEPGRRFRDGVAAGLSAIHRGAAEATELSQAEQVVIACSHDASKFLVMPRYDALRQILGEDVRLRIVIYHHSVQSLPPDPSADIVLTWRAEGVAPQDRAVVLKEGIRPRLLAPPTPPLTRKPSPARSPAGAGCRSSTSCCPTRAGRRGRTGSRSPAARTGRRATRGSTAIPTRWKPPPPGRVSRWAGGSSSSGRWKRARWSPSATASSRPPTSYYGVLTEKGRRKPLARKCLALFDRLR